jgi:hypothetical protein
MIYNLAATEIPPVHPDLTISDIKKINAENEPPQELDHNQEGEPNVHSTNGK